LSGGDKAVDERVQREAEGLREVHGVLPDHARRIGRETYETTMRLLERRDRRRR
jgi:hypothetical protein